MSERKKKTMGEPETRERKGGGAPLSAGEEEEENRLRRT
jgi:hypothetical protein